MSEIINKIAKSGLITIDLEELYPEGERIFFDLKELLFEGLVLKEKDFREFIAKEDWSKYQNKYVALACSADAIIAPWAYMLLSIQLQPYAKKIVFGSLEDLEKEIFNELIERLDVVQYEDQRIIIKGCSKKSIPWSAYVSLCNKLRPVAKSIMYGEPCSTVPLFKK